MPPMHAVAADQRQGAATVRHQCPDAVSIFLTAPWSVLLERVRVLDRRLTRGRVADVREEGSRADLVRVGDEGKSCEP